MDDKVAFIQISHVYKAVYQFIVHLLYFSRVFDNPTCVIGARAQLTRAN